MGKITTTTTNRYKVGKATRKMTRFMYTSFYLNTHRESAPISKSYIHKEYIILKINYFLLFFLCKTFILYFFLVLYLGKCLF